MINFAQYKVPEGKLLQLEKLSTNQYKITGDFFCHPESIIGELESALISSDPQHQASLIFTNPENQIIGFDLESLLNLYNQLQ